MAKTSNSAPVEPARRAKKPGPRPTACKWCQSTECSHCRCEGFAKCDHSLGEMCKRSRYKRRLVCNPCEKHKLRSIKGHGGAHQHNAKRLKLDKKGNSSSFKKESLDSASNLLGVTEAKTKQQTSSRIAHSPREKGRVDIGKTARMLAKEAAKAAADAIKNGTEVSKSSRDTDIDRNSSKLRLNQRPGPKDAIADKQPRMPAKLRGKTSARRKFHNVKREVSNSKPIEKMKDLTLEDTPKIGSFKIPSFMQSNLSTPATFPLSPSIFNSSPFLMLSPSAYSPLNGAISMGELTMPAPLESMSPFFTPNLGFLKTPNLSSLTDSDFRYSPMFSPSIFGSLINSSHFTSTASDSTALPPMTLNVASNPAVNQDPAKGGMSANDHSANASRNSGAVTNSSSSSSRSLEVVSKDETKNHNTRDITTSDPSPKGTDDVNIIPNNDAHDVSPPPEAIITTDSATKASTLISVLNSS